MNGPGAPDGMPAPGTVIAGRYRIEGELGRGGMGVVFRAQHLLLSQPVALKMMLPAAAQHTDLIGRLLQEARATARLENDHVARVMDVAVLDSGAPFIVMELLLGMDLGQLIPETASRPIAQVIDWLLAAMEAVAEAHSIGIVHRDLKPSNLFLAERKGGTVVKVLDFGISKSTQDRRTLVSTDTHAILGSPYYMSPEQLREAKSIDGRTDVWALGVVAYQLLTGTLPYQAASVVELFNAIMSSDPRPLRELRPEIPPELARIVLTCLERDLARRWPSVKALATSLARFGSAQSLASLELIDRLPVSVIATTRTEPSPAAPPPIQGDPGPAARVDPLVLPSAPSPPGSASPRADGASQASSMVQTTGALVRSYTRPLRSTLVAVVATVAVFASVGAGVLLWSRGDPRASSSPGQGLAPSASVPPPPPATSASVAASSAPEAHSSTTPPSPVAPRAARAAPAPAGSAPKKAASHGAPAEWF